MNLSQEMKGLPIEQHFVDIFSILLVEYLAVNFPISAGVDLNPSDLFCQIDIFTLVEGHLSELLVIYSHEIFQFSLQGVQLLY